MKGVQVPIWNNSAWPVATLSSALAQSRADGGNSRGLRIESCPRRTCLGDAHGPREPTDTETDTDIEGQEAPERAKGSQEKLE